MREREFIQEAKEKATEILSNSNMMDENIEKRILELKKKAISKYINTIDWKHIRKMLSEEEQEEYDILTKLSLGN